MTQKTERLGRIIFGFGFGNGNDQTNNIDIPIDSKHGHCLNCPLQANSFILTCSTRIVDTFVRLLPNEKYLSWSDRAAMTTFSAVSLCYTFFALRQSPDTDNLKDGFRLIVLVRTISNNQRP